MRLGARGAEALPQKVFSRDTIRLLERGSVPTRNALPALLGLTLLRPRPWVFAIQAGAVFGYTLTAALSMPELTIDHCGPLVKNLPVLMTVLLLWLDAPAAFPASARRRGAEPLRSPPEQRPSPVIAQGRGGQVSQAAALTASPQRSIATCVPLCKRSAASPRT